MKHLVLYGAVGGVALAIAAAALIKRKPKAFEVEQKMLIGPGRALAGPRIYLAKKGDAPTAVAARFGLGYQALVRANDGRPPLIGTSIVKLPAGVADMGPRTGAQGTVKS